MNQQKKRNKLTNKMSYLKRERPILMNNYNLGMIIPKMNLQQRKKDCFQEKPMRLAGHLIMILPNIIWEDLRLQNMKRSTHLRNQLFWIICIAIMIEQIYQQVGIPGQKVSIYLFSQIWLIMHWSYICSGFHIASENVWQDIGWPKQPPQKQTLSVHSTIDMCLHKTLL